MLEESVISVSVLSDDYSRIKNDLRMRIDLELGWKINCCFRDW